MFKNKNKNKLLVSKKGEREILKTIGEYKIFAPDKNFVLILDEIYEKAKKVDSDKIELDEPELLFKIFNSLTNIKEIGVEDFQEALKNPSEQKRSFKRARKYIEVILAEEISDYFEKMDSISNMAQPFRESYIENIKEAQKTMNEGIKSKKELYKQLKAEFEGDD